jgi:NADPH:quinone reductase-like Zn-dependent oxidoreductase
MAAVVCDDGVVCNYGSMSGEDARVGTADTIHRGVTLTGFLLGRFLARRSVEAVDKIYADIAAGVLSGSVQAPIGAVYPIEQIADALRHVQRPGHDGKILVAPNGAV